MTTMGRKKNSVSVDPAHLSAMFAFVCDYNKISWSAFTKALTKKCSASKPLSKVEFSSDSSPSSLVKASPSKFKRSLVVEDHNDLPGVLESSFVMLDGDADSGPLHPAVAVKVSSITNAGPSSQSPVGLLAAAASAAMESNQPAVQQVATATFCSPNQQTAVGPQQPQHAVQQVGPHQQQHAVQQVGPHQPHHAVQQLPGSAYSSQQQPGSWSSHYGYPLHGQQLQQPTHLQQGFTGHDPYHAQNNPAGWSSCQAQPAFSGFQQQSYYMQPPQPNPH